MLAAKAMRRPVFGWGGWGRSRVHDEWGTDLSITDGLWIIQFGQLGQVQLSLVYGGEKNLCPGQFRADD